MMIAKPAPRETKANLKAALVSSDQRLAQALAINTALAKRVAELELPPDVLEPLKVIAHACGIDGETLRTWCAKGHVVARQDGKLWSVSRSSAMARARRLGRIP